MKVAIVGCGSISRTHIGVLSTINDVTVVGVADCVPERAQSAAEKCGARAYESLESMLDGEDIDVLHICTPHYLHVPMALLAMERGINVLCEKPCAMSEDELCELRECQKKSGVLFGVCFQNRYNSSVQYLLSKVQSGEYGDVIGMRASVQWRRDADYYRSGDWRGTKAYEGGGVLINQAIHTLDLFNILGGGVSEVTAHAFNDHLKGEIEVEDTVSVFAQFKKGFRGIFNATTAAAVTHPIMLEICFEKNTLRIEGDRVYETGNGIVPVEINAADNAEALGKSCWGSGHSALINDFYSCIREQRPFEIDAFEGGKAVELMLKIYESAHTGETLKV